jgi:hypothetical protein
MQLSDLITSATKSVDIRGVSVPVRALSAAESMAIHTQIPDPVRDYAPGMTDAEKLRDDRLSGHIHHKTLARSRRRALIVAAACNLAGASGLTWSRGLSPQDSVTLADQVLESLSEGEILRAFNAHLDLEYGTDIGTGDQPGN